jgi:hypothetical protein
MYEICKVFTQSKCKHYWTYVTKSEQSLHTAYLHRSIFGDGFSQKLRSKTMGYLEIKMRQRRIILPKRQHFCQSGHTVGIKLGNAIENNSSLRPKILECN